MLVATKFSGLLLTFHGIPMLLRLDNCGAPFMANHWDQNCCLNVYLRIFAMFLLIHWWNSCYHMSLVLMSSNCIHHPYLVQILDGKDILNERTNTELRYLKKVLSLSLFHQIIVKKCIMLSVMLCDLLKYKCDTPTSSRNLRMH